MQKMFLYIFLTIFTSLACPLPAVAHVSGAEWGRNMSKKEVKTYLKKALKARKQARHASAKPKDGFLWALILLFAFSALIGGIIGILTWLVLGGLWWVWLLGGMIVGMAILVLMVDQGML